MPDLNSLPPSPPTATSTSPVQLRMAPANLDREQSRSPSTSHTPPHSLAAAATINAGIQTEESRRPSGGGMHRSIERARRRSSIRMNLNLNDPTLPGPGELQMSPTLRARGGHPPSPYHERAPSLGELHQELESEQEAQVNRLLHMIRQQQAQIATLTAQNQSQSQSSAIDDSTPTSERGLSLPHSASTSQQNLTQISPLNTIAPPRSRSPNPRYGDLSQHSYRDHSRGSSRNISPAIHPTAGALAAGTQHDNSEWSIGAPAVRDESAFYQAETQMLTRENQMLKLRIRELERQLAEYDPTSPITHTPATASHLATSSAEVGAEPAQSNAG